MLSLAISLRFVLGDFYCHVNVQRLLTYQWVSMLQQRPLVTIRRTANKTRFPGSLFGDRPEFVSSLEKLLVYSLCFHIRIQWVTPVTQSHWVCSAAAWNWEPCTQRNPWNVCTDDEDPTGLNYAVQQKKRVILRGETSLYLQN